mgnify:CR=1 FL=1|tara:strand:+ start:173 stop:496 length:324 start_codon:yes stop_codon:yes gene_type:complete
MDITGKLIKKFDTESGVSKTTNKEWHKQSVMIEQNTEYNKGVVISFFGDKIKSLRNVNVGDDVSISVNVSSREFNGKYYHNLDGWFIAKFGQETVGQGDPGDENMPF